MENSQEILKELEADFYHYFDYYRTDKYSGCSNFLTNKHIYTIVELILLPFSNKVITEMYIMPEWHSISFMEYYRGEWDEYGDEYRKETGIQLINKLNKIIENNYYNIELQIETILAGNLYNADILGYLQSKILSKIYKVLEQVYKPKYETTTTYTNKYTKYTIRYG